MHTKTSLKTANFPPILANAAFEPMTDEEFAELGADRVVFVNTVTGAQLNTYYPDAVTAPPNLLFWLLLSASGVPILVADNDEAIADWLDEREVTLVQRH